MRLSIPTTILAVGATSQLAAAVAVPQPILADILDVLPKWPIDLTKLAPKLPLLDFKETFKFTKPLSLGEALAGVNSTRPGPVAEEPESLTSPDDDEGSFGAAAVCSNPRVRTEWDSYSTSDRQAFVDALKCLMGRPASGRFSQARNRYEDFVALHQQITPNVHGSHKFLLWHRYYLYAFEDVLRQECGFNRNFPWFDETKYAGRFSASSIFSNQWFGAIGINGNCVTNGQFAGLTLNVGPGTGNRAHCLARNGNAEWTANTNQAMVNACNNHADYPTMANCAEGGAHAWGHNGIGAVMLDTYASPGDPVFWLHHAFIDRNFRIWQNANSARINTISGTDRAGNPLTMDTTVDILGLRPTVRIRDVLNTMENAVGCYRYNY